MKLIKRSSNLLCVLILSAISALSLQAQTLQPSLYSQLDYRFIGPGGGRMIAAIGIPGDPTTALAGAASGGIWKTTDYGNHWKPVFDDKDASSISALAIAPSAHNEMWAGTGETFLIRPAHAMGDGIYKSVDYGETWEKMGLEKTGRIGRIEIHPTNPDIVFACALGHSFGPQKERGVYRTTDGGKTWELVLHVNDQTGCNDLDINPDNPNIIYAAFWQLKISTWNLKSGGPYSGIYRSVDGGDTWKKLSGEGLGLPGGQDHPLGKVAVRVAPSEPSRVYVLAEETGSPAFYRSDDGGDSWRLVAKNHNMAERAPYYTRFAVDPENPDRIYFVSVRFSMSLDGGKSLVRRAPAGGGDNHDIWIDPTNADRYIVSHDGGLTMTLNKGESAERHILPVSQMYHVHVDNEIPYNVYGNRQDAYSYKGPSRSRSRSIPLGLWSDVGGCESGFSIPDTVDGYTVWSGCYDGGLTVFDGRNHTTKNVRVWPKAGYGYAPKDLKYRWHWTFPIFISPHNHEKVYVGSQYVHVTTDRGQSWEVISPDLTRDIESHQESSGGVAIDNLYTFDGATLFAIAESPIQKGLIWTGSNDGLVHVTKDGGQNWTNVTKNIPGMPKWGTIANVEPSWFDAGTAYISVDDHQQADFKPYIFVTEDYGQTWKKISDGIPESVHSFVHVVREDPDKEGALYAGTDNQIYYSPDDGQTWVSLRNNMPPAPIYWLTIQQHFDDLVVGTYGRGFYILDDISPLRNLTQEVMAENLHLFSFRPTYRFFDVKGIKTDPRTHIRGRNPQYGADINYYLKTESEEEAKIEIFKGDELIRTLQGPAKKGINRTWWNLRYESTLEPKLRTTPPNKAWVEENMPWVGEGREKWRPLVTWDLDLNRGQRGPRVVPGTYTVKVTVGDYEAVREIEIQDDPESFATPQDIQKQVALSLKIRDQLNEVTTIINKIEWIKKGFEELITQLEAAQNKDDKVEIINRINKLNKLVTEIEGNLFDINLSGAREDAFRNPMKLYGRISALGSDVQQSGGGLAPTEQQFEVYEELSEQFEEVKESYNEFIEKQLVPFLQDIQGLEKIPSLEGDIFQFKQDNQ